VGAVVPKKGHRCVINIYHSRLPIRVPNTGRIYNKQSMNIVIKLAPPHPGTISRIDTNRKGKFPEVEVILAFRVGQGNDVCGLCCIFLT
jgi:hypothetical protein